MRRPAPTLAPLLVLVAACAVARPSPSTAARGPDLLRPAELARVRCLLIAPIENATDAPQAAGAATAALEAAIPAERTRALPVAELRAILADTPLELAEGVPGGTALELAELVGADAALYGAVEGRSRGREPGLSVTLRLLLSPGRELIFAGSALVVPAAGEPLEAAVRRTVVDLARPALDRLGAPGPRDCFDPARREALRAAAVALRPPPPAPAPVVEAARPAPTVPTVGLRTARQRDWARRLGGHERVALDDVAFTGRTAELNRDGGLADLAQVLRATPELTIRLSAFVDASGDPAADGRLSLAMAQAAAKRLVELGVEVGRLSVAGRASDGPLVPNFTARGRAANRRIEVSSPR
jgi:outer membrane protein OmpA-like peptidoglycan-associated protein